MEKAQPEFELNDSKMNPLKWMVAIDKKLSPPLTGEDVYRLNKGLITKEGLLTEKTDRPMTEEERIKEANKELGRSDTPSFKDLR